MTWPSTQSSDVHRAASVNGPGFDMVAGEPPATGQIAVVDPDGTVRGVADGLAFPNGMAISSDGATLVVAESHGSCLTAYTITGRGDLIGRRVFAHVPASAPDGICCMTVGGPTTLEACPDVP